LLVSLGKCNYLFLICNTNPIKKQKPHRSEALERES
jgi:hypothetical protein